jgi:hypothetical protein
MANENEMNIELAKKFAEEDVDIENNIDANNGSEVNNKGEEDNSKTDNRETENTDNDGSLTWSDFSDSADEDEKGFDENKRSNNNDETDEQKTVRLEVEQNGNSENKNSNNQKPVISKEIYTELGVEENEPIEKTVEAIKKLKQENEELRMKTTPSKFDEQILKLNEVLKLKDDALMIKDLVLNGMNEEDAEIAVEKMENSGVLVIEARKLRNGINGYVGELENKKKEEYKESSSMNDKDLMYSKEKLKSHLENTQTMFDIKVAKNDSDLKKFQGSHYEYITSGKFLREITANESELAEIAFIYRNKNVIKQILKSRGENSATAKLLNTLKNVEMPGVNKLNVSTSKGAFDPRRFVGED